MAQNSANYDVEEVGEDLPPASGGGGGGKSPLDEQLAAIKADQGRHGKWFRIAHYKMGSVAGAAMGSLKKRHGDTPQHKGWHFTTRATDVKGYEDKRYGVLVKFVPGDVVEGTPVDKAKQQRLASGDGRTPNKEQGQQEQASQASQASPKQAPAAPTGNGQPKTPLADRAAEAKAKAEAATSKSTKG